MKRFRFCIIMTTLLPLAINAKTTKWSGETLFDFEKPSHPISILQRIEITNCQNTAQLTCFGNNIQIGRNVTTSKEDGPVIVDSNKTVVSSSGEVLIKNDFEVKKGAELCIERNIQP